MPDKITINCLPTGPLDVNTYIITSEHSNTIIDPGGNIQEILGNIDQANKTLILLTHAHFDHFGGLNELLNALPADTEYYAHTICAARSTDPEINLSLQIIGSPYTAFSPTPHP